MGSRSRAVLRPLVWALLYVTAGYVGRSTTIDGESLALVWPAAGVAVLWLCSGTRHTWGWDAAAIGVLTFVVNASTGAPVQLACVLVVTNLAQAGLFVALLRRLRPDAWGFGGSRPIHGLTDLSLVAAGAVVSSLVGATLGYLGFVWTLGATDLSTLAAWWGRTAAGMLLLAVLGLLVLPLLSGAADARETVRRLGLLLRPRGVRQLAEVLALTVVTASLLLAIFASNTSAPLAFLLLFTTVLAGVRLGPVGAGVHGLLTGAVATAFTLAGTGPFAVVESMTSRALIVQVFVMMTVLTGLMLAFSRAERDEALAMRDLTQRATADRAALFRAVLENMREGIAVVQEDGAILLRNPAGRRLLGLEGEPSPTVRASESYGLFHPDGRPVLEQDMPYARALAGDEVLAEDYVVRTPSSHERRILEITATQLAGEHPGGPARAVLNFRDVTSARQDHDHLASFVGVVAHDLTSPLTVVHGWADSLAEAFLAGDVDPATGAKMVGRIQSAAANMTQFINDLLAYTVAGESPLNVVDLDLSAIGREIEGIRRQDPRRPLIHIRDGMRVRADPVLVHQILDNLIGNAIKYVAPDVRPLVLVSGQERGEWLEVSVSDNGIGVRPQDRQRIFDKFERAHGEEYTGTGIGLAICRRAVQRHGGDIWILDKPLGDGSRFVFTLPLTPWRDAADRTGDAATG